MTRTLTAPETSVALLHDLAADGASQYDDIFVRANFGDSGSIPATGTLSTCPDIIPSGTQPVADPVNTFTNNYSNSGANGQDLVANAQNYIYMRGKNLHNGPETGTLQLYYSPASLLLYPSLWSQNQLKTSSGKSTVPVSAQNLGDIVVGQDPFTWVPQMPNAGDHYCLVGRVVTPSHPNPIPATGNISDFATYIANNRGMGWRNVVVVNAGSPTFTSAIRYNQGEMGGAMYVAIKGTAVPKGAQVSFSCGDSGPNPLINMAPYTATGTDFLVGLPTNIPANFASQISYSYFANNTTPLPNWSISMVVFYFAPPGHATHARGIAPHKLGIRGAALDDIGPSKAVQVGSQTMVLPG
jgi:hypothetical protein